MRTDLSSTMNVVGPLRKSVLLFALFLSAIVHPLPSFSAVIEGVVLSFSGPIENSTVYACGTHRDLANGNALYRSSAGEKPGFYRLVLPPGTYFLAASGNRDGAEYFSFHGANPVEIGDESLWIPFMALPKTEQTARDSGYSALSGVVMYKGRPVGNAQVSLYAPDHGTFRGMGLLTNTTDERGAFRFSPEPGEYVIIARKRAGPRGMAPLQKGDLFCYYAGNPVPVAASREVGIIIPCYPKDDLSSFLDEGVTVKRARQDRARFREKKTVSATRAPAISGRVTDLSGSPVKNLYVMAYRAGTAQAFQMHFIRTMPERMVTADAQGNYRLEVKGKDAYCVVAREFPGEAPSKGERYGLYEGNVNHRVEIAGEAATGIDIVVGKIMTEDGERKSGGSSRGGFETRPYTQKAEDRRQKAEERERKRPISVSDAVIDKDTVWEGEVFVEGTVLVARRATLTIEPGTTVRFRKIDRNNDGIGDGEIRVLGRLIAQGAPERMITFTSAEKNPAPDDWSYVLLFASGAESLVEYCIFEYAFTGFQAHFSRAVIRDSVFRKNREGIRFGRAELLIEHNDIVHNGYGIRHTRLEGPVEIRYNTIRANEVGIFLVPSNQNTQDFFVPASAAASRADFAPPVVRRNNISNNRSYNYRLGERQGCTITMEDNWWGDAREEYISRTIYDRMSDGSLGEVIFKPYRLSPVEAAGVRKGEWR